MTSRRRAGASAPALRRAVEAASAARAVAEAAEAAAARAEREHGWWAERAADGVPGATTAAFGWFLDAAETAAAATTAREAAERAARAARILAAAGAHPIAIGVAD